MRREVSRGYPSVQVLFPKSVLGGSLQARVSVSASLQDIVFKRVHCFYLENLLKGRWWAGKPNTHYVSYGFQKSLLRGTEAGADGI